MKILTHGRPVSLKGPVAVHRCSEASGFFSTGKRALSWARSNCQWTGNPSFGKRVKRWWQKTGKVENLDWWVMSFKEWGWPLVELWRLKEKRAFGSAGMVPQRAMMVKIRVEQKMSVRGWVWSQLGEVRDGGHGAPLPRELLLVWVCALGLKCWI